MSNKDLLTLLILESKSYSQVEDLEKLVEKSQDLSVLPLQPLYLAVKNCGPDQLAHLLPKMSSEQRQALIDLDVWNKDQLDMKRFSEWPLVYSKCTDEVVVSEFIQSEDFSLFLKARFNVYTFDLEEPDYPDHDHFFLTDDNLLLFEFDDDFEYMNEVRALIRKLYDELGVEKAYAHLFKMVSESYSLLEEECFNNKRERLRDFGFVDYHDSLFLKSSFVNQKALDDSIVSKKSITAELDDVSKNQTLHASSLVSYQTGLEGFYLELAKVTNPKRKDYLQFNFVRLVNGSLSLNQALKEGSVAINRVGLQTKQALELGFSYIQNKAKTDEFLKHKIGEQGLFEVFDFNDLYKVGVSLFSFEHTATKKVLHQSPFENEEFEYFLGSTLTDVLDLAFSEVIKFKTEGKVQIVSSLKDFEILKTRLQFVRDIIPFAHKFFTSFSLLKQKNLVNDSFYLNYEVDNIDLESILISSFINFVHGAYSKPEMNKMGLTVVELKKFVSDYFDRHGLEYVLDTYNENSKLAKKLKEFTKSFGLDSVKGVEIYLYGILDEQLSGYAYDELKNEEFKHVGGPILLNVIPN